MINYIKQKLTEISNWGVQRKSRVVYLKDLNCWMAVDMTKTANSLSLNVYHFSNDKKIYRNGILTSVKNENV